MVAKVQNNNQNTSLLSAIKLLLLKEKYTKKNTLLCPISRKNQYMNKNPINNIAHSNKIIKFA